MAPSRSPYVIYGWTAAVLVLGYVLIASLQAILTPFVVAAILAYICNPLVNRLEARRIPRSLAVVLVMLALLLAAVAMVLVLVPMIAQQSKALMEQLPRLADWTQTEAAPWLQAKLGVPIDLDWGNVKRWLGSHTDTLQSFAQNVLSRVGAGGGAALHLIGNLVLLPVVLFYFLRDWQGMLQQLEGFLPRRWHPKVLEIAHEIDAVLGEFLRGQLSVMLVMAAFYAGGLWLAGLKFALPIGVISGMLVFVPYLGAALGLLLSTAAGLLQFGSLQGLIPVWLVFGIGQTLEGMVVTPKLVGDRIGLHPVAVIFSLLAFGQWLGFVGVLLALPLSAMVLVGLRHVRQFYLQSDLYQTPSSPDSDTAADPEPRPARRRRNRRPRDDASRSTPGGHADTP